MFVKSTQDVDIWMEIPIQHDVYIYYSVFKLFKLYSNILKCVNLIELRFNAYLYAQSFLVLWHIFFGTTGQIPEVEFGGKYGYLCENLFLTAHWSEFSLGQKGSRHYYLFIMSRFYEWSQFTYQYTVTGTTFATTKTATTLSIGLNNKK